MDVRVAVEAAAREHPVLTPCGWTLERFKARVRRAGVTGSVVAGLAEFRRLVYEEL